MKQQNHKKDEKIVRLQRVLDKEGINLNSYEQVGQVGRYYLKFVINLFATNKLIANFFIKIY